MGKLLSSVGIAATGGHGVSLPPEVQRFKVTLARFAFYEVEVLAETATAAMAMAEQSPPVKPKLKFYTGHSATYAEVFQPWDGKWAKVPRA
ncbi:MAG TPA: hypothetical protein VL357_03220 [Rariglobus sp.]|nr:hypothetical protein [Rariglobus sp.]